MMIQCMSTKPVITIGKRRLRVERKIAEGGFANVILVTDLGGKPDALKMLASLLQGDKKSKEKQRQYAVKKIHCATPEQIQDAQREIAICREFDHPNIAPLIDAQFFHGLANTQDALLLLPYFPRGSLQKMIEAAEATGACATFR
jgi:serine/threonine protein kinase